MSKVFLTGQSFGETARYLCLDLERAQVLAVEGVRGHDYQLMEEDFKMQHRLMPEKEKPVFHGMLSFPPGEDPGNEKMAEIARTWLQEIGMANTQYAIVKHTDKAHLHLHILANRVNNEGRIIGEGMIIERGIRAARKLTREYGLKAEEGKNLELTNLETMRSDDAKRYRLYAAIRDALPGCREMEDLEKRLFERGITTRYKTDAEGERCGISFRIENHSFKGSQVDGAYSFRKLDQTVTLQRELQERQELALRKEREEKELVPRKEQELRDQPVKQDLRRSEEELKQDQPPALKKEMKPDEGRHIRLRLTLTRRPHL